MKLVPMKDILLIAEEKGIAVGAFEFWSFDSAQAVVRAANALGLPAILQSGSLERDYAGGCDKLYKIASAVAADYDIPVALHYDHGETFEEVKDAAENGYTSIMIDASHAAFDENVALTQKVVALAKRFGISTESELGILAGAEGGAVSETESQTKPGEAFDFVAQTGVDCLAVAIGTAHGLYRFPPKLNIERLREIDAKVDVPLVLHGGSGTPGDMVREAVRHGIRKVNICTEFVKAFGEAYAAAQARPGFNYNVPGLFGPSREAGYALAKAKMKLFALM